MRQVSIFEAKTHFSSLINDLISKGDSVEITRHGQPVAKISPLNNKSKVDIKTALKLIDQLREENSHSKTTLEEISEWKEEGRA